MAEIRQEMPPGNAGVAEATRIFAANPNAPLSREAAAQVLATRGVMPPGSDGRPTFTAPAAPEPEAYKIALPENMQIADGATPEGIQAGAAEWCAALGVSPLLGNVLIDDILGSDAPDPAAIRASLGNMNRGVEETYRDAEYALARASQRLGSDFVRATELPLRSLVHLADHGRLLRRREGR